MIRKIFFLFIFSFLAIVSAKASLGVYPPIKEFSIEGDPVTIPVKVAIIGSNEADKDALRVVQQLLETDDKSKFKITMGERGDKSIRKYESKIPQKAGGYFLWIHAKGVVLAGNDNRGTFYAAQTLKQILAQGDVRATEIRDYPSIAFRGVVEGFYGTPWSHQDRLNQLDFYGQFKLNTYIYGPKDDPFHSSPSWRKPYPPQEATHIKELVERAHSNKVDFVWAIHPGKDIRWSQQDQDSLIAKFEMMYQLGVRSYAVFFDDISGEGTNPQKQADLLNAIHERFIVAKKDVTPLIMCPTEYNKSWSNPKEGSYLDILGEKLHPSVQIMWTGDRVMSDITEEGMKWINNRIRRPAYIWWNFPVSDYVRNHLLMGECYGLDGHIEETMSGFVSNPMDKAEASKIAIYSIAGYAWNAPKYVPKEAWERGIREVAPEVEQQMIVFASHNSDPGKSYHNYRRAESAVIQPTINALSASIRKGDADMVLLKQVADEFSSLKNAAVTIAQKCQNKRLVEEIHPWLLQSELLGAKGEAVCAMIANEKNHHNLWQHYLRYLAFETQSQKINKEMNINPYQPGVVSGSLVLSPFIDSSVMFCTNRFVNRLAGNMDKKAQATLESRIYTSISQLKTLPATTEATTIRLYPTLEIFPLKRSEYIGLELPMITRLLSLQADLNATDFIKWGEIQISSDGATWQRATTKTNGTNISCSFKETQGRYIRVVNKSDEDKEVSLKKFVVTTAGVSPEVNDPKKIYDGNLSTAYHLQPKEKFTREVPAGTTLITVLAQEGSYHVHLLLNDGTIKKHAFDSGYASVEIEDDVISVTVEAIDDTITLHEVIMGK